jgi:hypothetical protein
MKQINSAYWQAMQGENPQVCELLEISIPSTKYYYTTCNVPVVSSGQIYDPMPGDVKSGQEESMDFGIGVLDFTLANTGTVIGDLLHYHGIDVSSVRMDRVFINSPDLGRDVIFMGQAGDIEYTRNQAAIQARNIWKSNQQEWPYYNYKNDCVWRFGGPGCGLDTTSITISGSIDLVGSSRINLVTVSGFLTGSYSNGYMDMGRVTITLGVNSGEARTVRAHSGDVLELSHYLPHSIANLTFDLYPGCRKRLVDDCTSRYNNSSAFLGLGLWAPKQERAF